MKNKLNMLVSCFIILLLFVILVRLKNNSKLNKFYSLSNISMCEGKRDGVSGCRKCCDKLDDNIYSDCVSNCMLF